MKDLKIGAEPSRWLWAMPFEIQVVNQAALDFTTAHAYTSPSSSNAAALLCWLNSSGGIRHVHTLPIIGPGLVPSMHRLSIGSCMHYIIIIISSGSISILSLIHI